MEFSIKDLNMDEVNNVIKSIDFETFVKALFYIASEIELLNDELKHIRNVLISIDKSVFKE